MERALPTMLMEWIKKIKLRISRGLYFLIMSLGKSSGLTVEFVKILGFKTHWIWFLDTQNTFYLMVKGLKNAYLMHFPSLHSWFRCSVCFYLKCSSSHNQRVIQRVKKHFFCQNLFQIMYNQKQKSNVHLRKNTKHLTVRGGWGGVNPYGQPDRKISGFFLTTSLTRISNNVLEVGMFWSRILFHPYLIFVLQGHLVNKMSWGVFHFWSATCIHARAV